MEQVYSPVISGMGTMQQVRAHLLKNGMSKQFTDLLAARYIKTAEQGRIVSIMDLFNSNQPTNVDILKSL
jgi:hypothetical protein